MRHLLFFFLCSLPSWALALGWGYENDPISLGMGKAHTCISTPYLSHHTDHLAFIRKPILHCFYQNNYWIPEIGYVGMGFIWPNKYINTGVSASFQGFEAYQEYSIGLSLAHFFKPYVSIALQGNYVGFYQAIDQSRYHSGMLHLAIRVFPISSLCIGFSAENLSFSQFKIADRKINIPVIFRLGIAYNFSKKVVVTVEITKDLEEIAQASVGIDYKCISFLSLRAGAYIASGISPSLGLGFHYRFFQCDIGCMYHFTNGFSASVGISFSWPT